MKATDLLGVELKVGDTVVRAVQNGNSPALIKATVTKVDGVQVWLDNSPRAIIFTDRLAVVNKS